MTEIEILDVSKSRLKTGQIYFGNSGEHCSCLIWYRNPIEALIEVTSDAPFPQRLRLMSAALGVNRLCRVIWREGRKVRVRFGT